MAEQKNANRLISNNKKAYFDYFIEDKYEAGLVLHGTEVKSIRMGKCSIKEAYIQIQNGEVFINNMNRIINRQFTLNVNFTLNDTNIYREKIQLEQCINNTKYL